MSHDRIAGSMTRPFFSMYINGVAAVGDTVEYSATLDVSIDQNGSTIGVTVVDERDEKKVSFRLTIGEAKILASLLASVASLVKADDETLEGGDFSRDADDDTESA
jgi:hypothetical protein